MHRGRTIPGILRYPEHFLKSKTYPMCDLKITCTGQLIMGLFNHIQDLLENENMLVAHVVIVLVALLTTWILMYVPLLDLSEALCMLPASAAINRRQCGGTDNLQEIRDAIRYGQPFGTAR